MTQAEIKSENDAKILKQLAEKQGFLSCRISKAEFLEKEAPALERWLRESRHGKMAYMENHFDKRLDPRLLVEGAVSLVSLSFNYFPENEWQPSDALKISKYAYGEDYHVVIKDKLKALLQNFQDLVGLEIGGRVFVDSAPVLEKAWATRNGTGWLGKHTNIIHPKFGSFFFLAEMILDIPLKADDPITDHCGTCTRCIDACPTDAIFAPYQLDASRCISYLTIELKEAIPADFQGKMENWIFGCDICQDVCPWNKKFSIAHQEPRFLPQGAWTEFQKNDWIEMTESVFHQFFSKSALKRTKWQGLRRNIDFSMQNSDNKEIN